MKLVTVAQMRAIEKQADESGLSYARMMENAGAGLAEAVLDLADALEGQPVVVGLVGAGNNGGDTLVALAALAAAGWKALAYVAVPRPREDPYLERVLAAGGSFAPLEQDEGFLTLDAWLDEADILLDGLIGTGLKLPIKPALAGLLEHVSQQVILSLVVAVDCPSGVDCETGEAAPQTIPADLTVCMAAVKTGLLRLPAFEYVGELLSVDIGLPEDLALWKEVKTTVATAGDVAASLPARPLDAHKGTFGQALIAAGSTNYTGAALLAGRAAYQVGAGLVRLAIPAPLHAVLAGQLPEATWLILPHEQGVIAEAACAVLLKNLEKASALLVGPGLGLEITTAAFISNLLTGQATRSRRGRIGFLAPQKDTPAAGEEISLPPLVVDADALKLVARVDEWWKLLPEQTVLTPHPGEMAILTGRSLEEIQTNRAAAALEAAKKWDCVVILKGAFTVVAAPTGQVCVVPVATPALAKAGTGDVLAGMVVGLMAQGVPAFKAAVSAAWLHAQAGLYAQAEFDDSTGVVASDVLSALPAVYSRLAESD